ncbi:FeoA family protein [Nodosilinea nodulosa]|uniref:FeoA family protein n=1 Tax=Nodosilinea nodulosa TaxID=416001 RepID=UPI0002EE2FAC|nr:FeoA family protein [Nodosilinea nodulosa]
MLTHPCLVDLKPGQSATIAALPFDLGLQHRFGALGLRCGQEVHVLRHGLLKGPLHVRVGMTEVMMRHCDARQIAISTTGQAA